MGKLKTFIKKIPLTSALILTMSVWVIVAVFLSKTTTDYVKEKLDLLQSKYFVMKETEEITDSGSSTTIFYEVQPYSEEDARAEKIYMLIYRYSSFFWCMLAVTSGTLLFYFGKLKKPINELVHASERIASDDLDFTIDYDGGDELGNLCASFEKMRISVQENNQAFWRTLEQRRLLNKMFSHELRTPLTVLKGNTELLTKVIGNRDVPEQKKAEMLESVQKNISRIENSVLRISAIDRAEDLAVQRRPVPAEQLLSGITEVLTALCNEKGLKGSAASGLSDRSLYIDPDAVLQVSENLISNAVRFAKSAVTVSVSEKSGLLQISVSDDGEGFAGQTSKSADSAHDSGQKTDGIQHFGLGLYLCRLICEKHGGTLVLDNNIPQGANVTASFSC